MKKKNSPPRRRIMKIWEEGTEATDWGVREGFSQEGSEATTEEWENTLIRSQRRWAFGGGGETRCVSLEKKKNLFSRGVKSKPLPSCMSKAFSQYQCPLLILFNIESILEIIHVVLGEDSWLLCKGGCQTTCGPPCGTGLAATTTRMA